MSTDIDIDIVVVAAGRSARMRGTDKLLEPVPTLFGTAPLVQVVARRAAQAGRAHVVLEATQDARRAALADVSAEIVELEAAATGSAGLGVSIAAGVAASDAQPGGADRALMVVLADMPEVLASDMHLLAALSRKVPRAILRAAGVDGTPGHPVLFPADLRPALRQLSGDTGARDLLRAEAARLHLVPLNDDRALVDLDTPDDWATWRAKIDRD